MGKNERQERLLKEVFEEAHRASRQRTPPFASLWSRAAERRAAPPPARGHRAAVAALAAAVVVVALLVGLRWAGRRPPDGLEQAAAAAAAISRWRAPLDFLLDTPGSRWLETTPSWEIVPAIDLAEPGHGSTEEVTP